MSKSPEKPEISTSVPMAASSPAEGDDMPDIDLDELLSETSDDPDVDRPQGIALPDHTANLAGLASSGSLERLIDTARNYASKATSENTTLAYKKDWAHFSSWCRRRGANMMPPSPALVGLYITECASPQNGSPGLAVSTIERRLSGLSSNYRQRGVPLDLRDRHIATVWVGIKNQHKKPPVQKEAVLIEDILEMVSLLSFDLRDMRDRAILLVGYAGGLRRSEIVGLDIDKDESQSPDADGRGWIEIEKGGAVINLRGKTGWREVEIGRGSSDATCPVHALEQWLHYAKLAHGPVFRRVSQDCTKVLAARLSDKHVARLIKRLVLESGVGPEKLSDEERVKLFSGHSLRAGLASSAEVDERYVQKQLGHASAEMTRRYQRRRDRFRVNLTKAAGL